MWMTYQTQVLHKDVENLFRKVILMLEKAAILKNCRRSRKIKIQIPHSQKYMI